MDTQECLKKKVIAGYYYYKTYIDSITEFSTIDALMSELNNIPLKDPSDYTLILYDEGSYFSNDNGSVSEFFLHYLNDFYWATDGRIYEYYGIDEEAYMKKIELDGYNDIYIGAKYSTTDNSIILYFSIIASILTLLYVFVIYIWSKNMSENIVDISLNFKKMSNKNILENTNTLYSLSNDEIGDLVNSFNKIQKLTQIHIHQIQDNQSILMEKERLASLGQLIGGIAHNLKTPIMSISGASEGLRDLIKEYDTSIEDPEVNFQDHHEIAAEMEEWIKKIRTHTEYMSDIITAVKGQAVNFNNTDMMSFTIDELLKRIDILMKHELKNSHTYLNVSLNVPASQTINGDVNSLIQVINNMISNSIQAYGDRQGESIDLAVDHDSHNNVLITVKDYGNGLPEKVKDKLFKEMITTKGKNGTGLGLYMSYSTIKGNFNGDITVDSEEGKGTSFTIILPKGNSLI